MTEPLGYYPEFKLPLWFNGSDSLRSMLHKAWAQRYRELYEKNTDASTTSLESTFEEVLSVLYSPNDAGHHRCVWMARIMALAVLPTVESYLPDDSRPTFLLQQIAIWLEGGTPSLPEIDELFPQKIVPPQALNEALDVFRNLIQVIKPEVVHQALMEILDDCFEGYAIFPGSEGKRDLFNWWLIEVVPAAWCQRLPDAIYTMKWPWPPQIS